MPMKFTRVLASLLLVSLAFLQTYGTYSIKNNNEQKTRETKAKCEQGSRMACRTFCCHFCCRCLSLFLVVLT